MGHIYREKAEIPIPNTAHVNGSNGQVSVYELDGDGHRTGVRKVIGLATSDTTMHPNDNFCILFPQLWEQYYDEQPVTYELHVGLYAAILGLSHATGIYPLLDKMLGHVDTNAVMDYVLYSIKAHSSTTQYMADELYGILTFSPKVLSDSFYSHLFTKRLAAVEIDLQFRLEFLSQCAKNGAKKVWLCIDGSNNDCQVTDSDLAEHGKAKSRKNVNIISYMWAVNADDGRPITWLVSPGGTHDSKAFQTIIQLITQSGIEIMGVIVDKGFATQDVLNTIRDLGYDYVIKLTDSSTGHKQMMAKYAENIRMNVDKSFLINDRVMFGTVGQEKMFSSDDRNSFIGLYYDCVNGAECSAHLIAKVLKEARHLKAKLQKNPAKLEIPTEMKKYLEIIRDENGNACDIGYKATRWQSDALSTGFSSIACSLDLSAEEIDHLYDLRDVSEKQYSVLKSQLGFHTTRVHTDNAIKSRMLVAFIASVLRTELSLICRNLGLDTNVIIGKLNRISFLYQQDGKYFATRDLNNDLRKVLESCGVESGALAALAAEVNARKKPVHSDYRKAPEAVTPKGPGRPRKIKVAQAFASNEPTQPKRKGGRPKGSKNKKTIEREQLMREQGIIPVKRKPGRPKGSKNKSTLERERLAYEQGLNQVKRGPGRPKGSKNKKTLEREDMEAKLKAIAARHHARHAARANGNTCDIE